MSKLFLSRRLPADYNRQAWHEILVQIETEVNKQVDGYLFPITSVTSDYSATINDAFLPVNATSGGITITLKPAAEAASKRLTIKKTDSSANAVTVSGTENIDGAATAVISGQYDSICVMSDGTEWWIV